MNDGSYIFAFAIAILLDLLTTRNSDFVTFSIGQQYFFIEYLVNFTGNDFSHQIFILLEKNVFLQVFYLLNKRLSCGGNSTTAEILNKDLFRNFLADLEIR